MTRGSIYHKTCPACSALVKIDIKRCACGYSFDDNIQKDHQLPEDQVAHDEELLKEYLFARLSQAVSELQVTEAALASDPKNLDKANNLLRAFAQVRGMRTELETQSVKVAQARKIARAARGERGMAVDAADAAETSSNPSPEPTDAFRAAQSKKAESIMKAAGMDTKTCPKCRAILPERAALCFCGFTFSRQGTGPASQKQASPSRLDHRKPL